MFVCLTVYLFTTSKLYNDYKRTELIVTTIIIIIITIILMIMIIVMIIKSLIIQCILLSVFSLAIAANLIILAIS